MRSSGLLPALLGQQTAVGEAMLPFPNGAAGRVSHRPRLTSLPGELAMTLGPAAALSALQGRRAAATPRARAGTVRARGGAAGPLLPTRFRPGPGLQGASPGPGPQDDCRGSLPCMPASGPTRGLRGPRAARLGSWPPGHCAGRREAPEVNQTDLMNPHFFPPQPGTHPVTSFPAWPKRWLSAHGAQGPRLWRGPWMAGTEQGQGSACRCESQQPLWRWT